MAVQQFPLPSTAIANLWYDAETEEMWIQFNKRRSYPKYHYEGVSGKVFAEMLNAPSAGEYFHRKIKNNFQSTTLRGPGDQIHVKLNQWTLFRGLD
jgi:hypothetical protein